MIWSSGSHIYNFRPCREWNKAECDCTAADATCPGGYNFLSSLVDTLSFLLHWPYIEQFPPSVSGSVSQWWVSDLEMDNASTSLSLSWWIWNHLNTRWIHNGCWWTKVLHSEVSMMIRHHQYPWTKVIVLKGLTDQVVFYFVFLLQERSNANIWYWFCRKGQTSWSDANTRCQSEGDDSLAIIT